MNQFRVIGEKYDKIDRWLPRDRWCARVRPSVLGLWGIVYAFLQAIEAVFYFLGTCSDGKEDYGVEIIRVIYWWRVGLPFRWRCVPMDYKLIMANWL